MKRHIILLAALLILPVFLNAQQAGWFYATMDSGNAQELKAAHPDGIEILQSNNDQSVVFVEEEVAHQLHGNFVVHGPGFVYKPTFEAAASFIQQEFTQKFDVMDFTITEDAFVNQCLDMVNPQNIEETILDLQGYGTRYHQSSQAEQAVLDMRDKWQAMADAAGRDDISFRVVDHTGTPMPSLVMTMQGIEQPDEYVIIGGHIDSITSTPDDAPGADDNASGIGSITEIIRVLLDANYHPGRTVEFMAYAAEEIGLVGSDEIAQEYYNEGKDVVAYVQFDMTNYHGSAEDIAIIEDNYTTADLNLYLIELLEHYNASGNHALTYTSSACNYACSDHASWEARGYLASFPFEAKFGEHDPYIHSTQDLYSVSGSSEHAAKFTKLGLEFIIEVAKTATMSTHEVIKPELSMVVENKNLIYNLDDTTAKKLTLSVLDGSAKTVLSKTNLSTSGNVSLSHVPKGFYIAVFKDENGKAYTKKFLVK